MKIPSDVKVVLSSGAGGGLVSWAFSYMTNSSYITKVSFVLGKWEALPLCIILGAASALIAVYVVTPTDVSKIGHLIGFAVLCGFLWKPVLDAGRTLIDNRIKVAESSAKLDASISQAKKINTPADKGVIVHEVAAQASDLLRTSDRVPSGKLEKEATQQAKEAVEVISQSAPQNPVAAALALEEIRSAAEVTDRDALAELAGGKIQAIQQSAPSDLVPLLPPP